MWHVPNLKEAEKKQNMITKGGREGKGEGGRYGEANIAT